MTSLLFLIMDKIEHGPMIHVDGEFDLLSAATSEPKWKLIRSTAPNPDF